MRKKQAGQMFILVLILLAVGAMLVVPTLRLTGTALKSSQIATGQVKNLYAADAAQEWVLWKLKQPDFANSLQEDVPYTLEFDACGAQVTATVIMRALEGEGGVTLATDDVIKPTKTVTPNQHAYSYQTYTYTITLEQLSENTTRGLDAIYDILPGGLTTYVGPTEISLDSGATWQTVPGPYIGELGSKGYIKWPADYNKDTGAGAFSSDPGDSNHYFQGIRDFTPRQVKMLRFKMYGRLAKNSIHCNWVVLKPWNTLSGPQAPIAVDIANTGECPSQQSLTVSKASDPDIIPPGVETDITYTISIKNTYTQSRDITDIIDYLPPGFYYIGPTTSSTSPMILAPATEYLTLNGVVRQALTWTKTKFPGGIDLKISSGQTITITFKARTTRDISGLYYNEVMAILKETGISQAFTAAGVTPYEYGQNYSWNTGAVMVPAYDSSTEVDGTTIDANMSFSLEGITITSFHVR